MKKTTSVMIISFLIVNILILSCKRNNNENADLTLSQSDIDLLVTHKVQIDMITGKYDSELQKNRSQMKAQIIENGKTEINKYLESKGLDPVIFMKKSKKILKGYLAFHETGPEALERKTKFLQSQEMTEKQYEQALQTYKKSNEDLFREYTLGLSDYEIELIKMNFRKLSGVIKHSALNSTVPEKKTGSNK